MSPRDAFEGYDEPVNIALEFEDALKVIMDPEQLVEESPEVVKEVE